MSSKIKVDTIENVAGSGNVSLGSGHNLVVPGNITGQGTAAITSNATVGGTLGVTGNLTVDTNTLHVDSSNNKVGIGTTTVDRQLHIEANNSGAYSSTDFDQTYNLLKIENNNTTNNVATGLQFLVGTNGSASITTTRTGDGEASLCFGTRGGGSRQERMRIDHRGRVLKPNQPAFRVSRTAGNYTSAATIVWNNVIYNQGSHYDNSNGRFTAPVAGAYQFNVMGSVTASPANSGIHRAWINGNAQADMFPICTASAQHISYSSSFVFNLSANDYVYITAASTQWYGTGNVHNHFSGFLIG